MSIPQVYFVNYETRMRQTLGGRGPDHESNIKQAIKDGYVEVSVDEQDVFGLETQKLIASGWNKSPRTLKNFAHLLRAGK